MSVRHTILGFLHRQPMSGYDIKRFLERFSWLIGSPSFGSLYPALHALLEDDLVTVEVVSREDRPPRKIYSITEAGRRTLQEWVGQAVETDSSLKTFIMCLILASSFPQARLIAHLQQRRAQVADQHAALEQAIEIPGEAIDLGQHLALGYGLAIATAELTWLDSTLDQLPQQSQPVEVVQGERPAR